MHVGHNVAQALRNGEPVVAIETTLFTHGQAAEDGRDLLRRVIAIAIEQGAAPAVVGVIAGRIEVHSEPEAFDALFAPDVGKLAARDLCSAIAAQSSGATTVSAALSVAQRLGIRVQMTGGIGGVHRGQGRAFDISADLLELSRCGVALVCCGAKPVLDLPQTLESLESLSVPVVGWGCAEFPAFLTNCSGLPLTHRIASAAEGAHVARAHWMLGDQRGLLFAVPVPESAALAADQVSTAVDGAVESAREAGIVGAALTPYLVRELDRRTERASARCNGALVVSNASLSAQLAVALACRRALTADERDACWRMPWAI